MICWCPHTILLNWTFLYNCIFITSLIFLLLLNHHTQNFISISMTLNKKIEISVLKERRIFSDEWVQKVWVNYYYSCISIDVGAYSHYILFFPYFFITSGIKLITLLWNTIATKACMVSLMTHKKNYCNYRQHSKKQILTGNKKTKCKPSCINNQYNQISSLAWTFNRPSKFNIKRYRALQIGY